MGAGPLVWTALRGMIVLTLLLGVLYPLVVRGIGPELGQLG